MAEAQGQQPARDQLLEQLKETLEAQFDDRHSTYFFQDSTIGTFVVVPPECDSIAAMNDRHIHYGYWIMAATNVAPRDLGIDLHTSEIASIQEYWFDLEDRVFAADHGKPYASMMLDGKHAHSTWSVREPRQILGINLLPITPASTCLGADPTDAALALWDRRGAIENGEARTHTLYWLSSLKEMGRPDFTVRAN